MDFKHDPIQTLTIPETAGPGDERMVITSDLPPPLDTYTWGPSNIYSYIAGIIWYAGGGDDSTYNYVVSVRDSTSIFPGVILHVGGQVLSGGVVADIDGTPKCSEYHMVPSGGDIHYLRADEIHIRNDTDLTAVPGTINLETNNNIVLDAHNDITIDADHNVILRGRGGGGIQVTNTFSFNLQGVNPFRMYKANGDSTAALEIDNTGKMSWGAGGSSSLDTVLYRGTADILQTEDLFRIIRVLVTDLVLASRIFADSVSRWVVTANGDMEWGDGTLARDTNLYRSAPSVLATDDRVSQREMTVIYAMLTATAIASGGAGIVGNYDTMIADFWGMGHIAGTFVIPAGFAGKWTAETHCQFSQIAAPGGIRLVQFRKNGAVFAESRPGTNLVANQPTTVTLAQSDVFAVGDTFDVLLFHSQGVGLTYGGAGQLQFRTTFTYRGRVV